MLCHFIFIPKIMNISHLSLAADHLVVMIPLILGIGYFIYYILITALPINEDEEDEENEEEK